MFGAIVGGCVCVCAWLGMAGSPLYEAGRLPRPPVGTAPGTFSLLFVNQGEPTWHHATGKTKPNQPEWREKRHLAAVVHLSSGNRLSYSFTEYQLHI